MNPKDPIDKAVLKLLADLATDIAALRKTQIETIEAIVQHVPALQNAPKLALLSEAEQGLSVAQSIAIAAQKMKESLGA